MSFKVVRVGNLTNKGDKIVTGSNTMYTDMGGGASYSSSYKGGIYTYTAKEINTASTDDIDYNDMTPDQKKLFDQDNNNSDTQLDQANSVSNNVAPISTGCDDITGEVPYSYQLSTHFKLSDFTTGARVGGHKLVAQHGLTIPQIICNLKAVAINCAEPLMTKYGRVNVNSGFRPQASADSKSQHEKGQAVDFQFDGLSQDEIWARALWIKDNIAYDQFILEYSGSTNNCWFHLSFSKTGNRKSVLTMHNSFVSQPASADHKAGSKYRTGLVRMR